MTTPTETPRIRPKRDMSYYGISENKEENKENKVEIKKIENNLNLNNENFNSEKFIEKLVEFKSLKEITQETVNIQKGF
jgi:hypothetical protein